MNQFNETKQNSRHDSLDFVGLAEKNGSNPTVKQTQITSTGDQREPRR